MRIFVNRIHKKIPAKIQFPPVFSGSRILQGVNFFILLFAANIEIIYRIASLGCDYFFYYLSFPKRIWLQPLAGER